MQAHDNPFEEILGLSAGARAIRAFGARAAAVDAPVLLTGESGTGKGLLARAIHRASPRSRGPFVVVNCAGVPDSLFESEFFGHSRGAFTGAQQAHRGLLEQSHNGTLMLDEIGELALPLQAKLLTALEEGEFRRLGGERTVRVDLRLVAATSVDLHQAVRLGTFRNDLFHRLMVLVHRLPALRERPGDLDVFVEHLLPRLARKYGRAQPRIEDAALERLRASAWPGNVRQLQHTLEAALLACDGTMIRCRHLPDAILRADPPAATQNDSTLRGPSQSDTDYARPPVGRYSFFGSVHEEHRVIRETLRRCRGNKTRAAAELGMARNTLRAKLRAMDAERASGQAPTDD